MAPAVYAIELSEKHLEGRQFYAEGERGGAAEWIVPAKVLNAAQVRRIDLP